MTVALDFDGVIHGYSRGWQGGKIYDPPMPGAIEAIREIQEVEAVVVHTARTDLVSVAAWLRAQGIECVTQDEWDAERPAEEHGSAFWNEQERVLVTNRKPAARVYLDDRAALFTKEGGWEQALMDMDIVPAEPTHLYLVTVKLPKNPVHNPRRKQFGACPVNGEPCSDTTGEHHTFLVRSKHGGDHVTKVAAAKYGHVTRVESVPGEIEF